MILIPENLNSKGLTRLTSNVRSLIGRVKRYYPNLTFDILEKEVIARLKTTQINEHYYCELTGLKFNDMGTVFLIPVNPYTADIVSINQVLIVHQQTVNFWFELHKIMKESPDFIAVGDTKAQLRLIHDTLRAKSKTTSLSPEVVDLSLLIERSSQTPERIINLKNRLADPLQPRPVLPVFKASDFVRKASFYSDRAILRKIEMCKERSKSKGFTSDLTFENSKHLFNVTHCQLTGLPLVKATKTQEDNPFGFSIDRINRFEGYNVSNLLIVAHEVNKIKSKLEWSNYTESVENLREILTQAKEMMLKRHAHDNLHNRKQPLPIDTIIENYLAKDENHKKFIFG
jgi:hypothetical protein